MLRVAAQIDYVNLEEGPFLRFGRMNPRGVTACAGKFFYATAPHLSPVWHPLEIRRRPNEIHTHMTETELSSAWCLMKGRKWWEWRSHFNQLIKSCAGGRAGGVISLPCPASPLTRTWPAILIRSRSRPIGRRPTPPRAIPASRVPVRLSSRGRTAVDLRIISWLGVDYYLPGDIVDAGGTAG